MTEPKRSSIIISSGLVKEYKTTGDQYLQNAFESTDKKELRKASELFWGAIVQYLKALAATKDITIVGLKDLYQFVRELAKNLSSEYIYNEFSQLHILHTNFYDENVPEDDFPVYRTRALQYMEKINELVRTAVQQSANG